MGIGSFLLVHRGPSPSLAILHGFLRELLGGHLRPDVDLAISRSAAVRVDRKAARGGDPLSGTVRVVHLTASNRCGGEILTEQSRQLLVPRLGMPAANADQAWDLFAPPPLEAMALLLSKETGPVATLCCREDSRPVGAYSIWSSGRRLWSAAFHPGQSIAVWDGSELRITDHKPHLPPPPEGGVSDFPVRGLELLFGHTLHLSRKERIHLLPSLWRATRPPTAAMESMILVEGGRFLEPGRPVSGADWERFSAELTGWGRAEQVC